MSASQGRRGRPAEEVDDDDRPGAPARRAASACPSSWTIADSEEREGDDDAQDPAHDRAESGAIAATWLTTVTAMTARMMAHDTWTRTSKPNRRASGSALIARPRRRVAGAAPAPQRGADRLEPAGDDGDDDGHDDGDDPERDRGLLPELEREELDEPLGRRIEGVAAAREEQPVEDLEQLRRRR